MDEALDDFKTIGDLKHPNNSPCNCNQACGLQHLQNAPIPPRAPFREYQTLAEASTEKSGHVFTPQCV